MRKVFFCEKICSELTSKKFQPGPAIIAVVEVLVTVRDLDAAEHWKGVWVSIATALVIHWEVKDTVIYLFQMIHPITIRMHLEMVTLGSNRYQNQQFVADLCTKSFFYR